MEKFFRKNLQKADEAGTEEQKIDMGGVIAVTQRNSAELSDFMGGRRSLKNHQHHDPKDLADAVIRGVEKVIEIRREIGN